MYHYQNYAFADLKTLLAKATPIRSGDQLAGIAANSLSEMVAAQCILADLPLQTFLDQQLIPSEQDEVTRLILKQHDYQKFTPFANMSVGECRDFLLSDECTTKILTELQYAFTPEMIAAISKIMRNQDLISVAKKCRVVSKFRNTIGLKGRFSTRLQPNDPTDDLNGITSAIIEGLLYGCGDAVIGINPATDNQEQIGNLLTWLDTIRQRLNAPIQTCVLTHITNSIILARQGVPIDLFFQSIGGTEAVNKSFGVDLATLKEAHELGLSLHRGTVGNDCMYFETGQGTALSANAHHGIDQQTLEVRAYAVAREFSPLLVNTVVGFIGPEYLLDGKQITRAALEDHFCGKMLGLPMGVDVCYTNHSRADQNDMDNLLILLAEAGCNFVMAIPGADDVMLNYQSTSYHDLRYIRKVTKLKPSPEFDAWLNISKLSQQNKLTLFTQNNTFNKLLPDASLSIPASEASQEIKPSYSAIDRAITKFKSEKSDRVFDLSRYTNARIGMGHTGGQLQTKDWLKFQFSYAQANDALTTDFPTIRLFEYCLQKKLPAYEIFSDAKTHEQFLLRPDLGRALSQESKKQLIDVTSTQNPTPELLIIISGGLSPLAIEQQATGFLDAFLPLAKDNDWTIAPIMINTRGRVALGDQVNGIINAKMVIMLIGERPGLSSPDSMGIYFTYRAQPGYTDEKRNCISNIHAHGMSHEEAADRLSYLITKAFALQMTGVGLKDDFSKIATPTRQLLH